MIWWQNAFGMKAVLGQVSNWTPPGPRAPSATLILTRPTGTTTPPEIVATEEGLDCPTLEQRANHAETHRDLAAAEKRGEPVTAVVFFVAVMLLECAHAAFLWVRAMLAVLAGGIKRGRHWWCMVRQMLIRSHSRLANPIG